VSKISETAVMVQWSIAAGGPPVGGSPTVAAFKLYYTDVANDRSPDWQVIDEDIAPSRRFFEVLRLRGGEFQIKETEIRTRNDNVDLLNKQIRRLGMP